MTALEAKFLPKNHKEPTKNVADFFRLVEQCNMNDRKEKSFLTRASQNLGMMI